jgi:hypothetical protein
MTAGTTTVKIAVAALAALLGTAALAFAGVSLPAPAQDAFTRLGLSLPNQNEGAQPSNQPSTVPAATLPDQASDRADDVLNALRSDSPPGDGCQFGHDTAEEHADLPSQAECDHAGGDHPSNHGDASPNGSPQTGVTHSAKGRSTAQAAPQGSSQTGENASQIGQSNSTSAPQGGVETGQTVSTEAGPPSSTPPVATGPPSGTPGGRP